MEKGGPEKVRDLEKSAAKKRLFCPHGDWKYIEWHLPIFGFLVAVPLNTVTTIVVKEKALNRDTEKWDSLFKLVVAWAYFLLSICLLTVRQEKKAKRWVRENKDQLDKERAEWGDERDYRWHPCMDPSKIIAVVVLDIAWCFGMVVAIVTRSFS